LQQDRSKAIELWKQAAKLGSSQAHFSLGVIYIQEGNLKKAKIHYEAAAMAGDEVARGNLAKMEFESMNFAYMELEFGKKERAVKHLRIAASAGCYQSMKNFMACFEKGYISRDEIDSILTAYNNSCAEMRSEARDKYILDLRTRPQPR
jgi:TPR repeat protein